MDFIIWKLYLWWAAFKIAPREPCLLVWSLRAPCLRLVCWWLERGRNDGMSLLRLGYKRPYGFHLGLSLSFPFSLGLLALEKVSCHVKQPTWLGPEIYQQPCKWAWKGIRLSWPQLTVWLQLHEKLWNRKPSWVVLRFLIHRSYGIISMCCKLLNLWSSVT